MTKITIYTRGIIIDGHADTKEECETITLLCDSLAKDKNFKQVAYDDGYAAFKRVGKAERLKFPPITYNLKGGEFHFCVLNSFYNSTAYGSPIANTLIYCGVFTTEFTQSFTFTSNGVSYDSIHLIADKNTPDNRKMYYVSGNTETLVYHNNTWTQEAYKILTYETQNVREGIYELITGTAAYGVSGGFVAPNGTYEVSAPLAAISDGTAFVFSQFESNGAIFNAIQWNTDTVKYISPSVGDVYTPTLVYQGGWIEVGYKIITIPAGTYMTYSTIDIFAERLTASSTLSVDLTTLSGWANLTPGNHTIKIVAKGTGYRESELSAGVVVSKAGANPNVVSTTGLQSNQTLVASTNENLLTNSLVKSFYNNYKSKSLSELLQGIQADLTEEHTIDGVAVKYSEYDKLSEDCSIFVIKEGDNYYFETTGPLGETIVLSPQLEGQTYEPAKIIFGIVSAQTGLFFALPCKNITGQQGTVETLDDIGVAFLAVRTKVTLEEGTYKWKDNVTLIDID